MTILILGEWTWLIKKKLYFWILSVKIKLIFNSIYFKVNETFVELKKKKKFNSMGKRMFAHNFFFFFLNNLNCHGNKFKINWTHHNKLLEQGIETRRCRNLRPLIQSQTTLIRTFFRLSWWLRWRNRSRPYLEYLIINNNISELCRLSMRIST